MAIDRAHTGSFGVGEKLTSGVAEQMDLNPTYALDKRVGQTDTLSSVVSTAVAGRIIEPTVIGANANTTYLASGANRQIVLDDSITVDRVYILGNTDALAGDRIRILAMSTLTQHVTIRDVTGPTTLCVMSPGGPDASFVYHAGAWRLAEGDAMLADLAALTAIPAPHDGMVCHVLGQGSFTFKTSATTGLAPFRLAADDATAGGWLSNTAHETTLTRTLVPGWLPLRATSAVGTPSLALPIGVAVDANITTTRGGVQFITVNTGAATAHGFTMSINEALVDGATITSIVAQVRPANGHGALPALLPSFGVVRVDNSNNSSALLSTGAGLVSDPTILGSYSAQHSFTFTPDQNATIDKTAFHYGITAFNEGFTNALSSLAYYSFTINMTLPADARRS